MNGRFRASSAALAPGLLSASRAALALACASLFALSSISCRISNPELFDYFSDPLPPPLASVDSGDYHQTFSVYLQPAGYSTEYDNSTQPRIFYATDPDLSQYDFSGWSEFQYTTPNTFIQVSAPTNLRCFTWVSDVRFSEVKTYTWNLKPETPSTNPAPGSYENEQTITFNQAKPIGSMIYYTFASASPPSQPYAMDPLSWGGLYSGSMSFSLNATSPVIQLRAIARYQDWLPSDEFTGIYAIRTGSADVSVTVVTPSGTSLALTNAQNQILIVSNDDISVTLNPLTGSDWVYTWYLNGDLLTDTGSSITVGKSGPDSYAGWVATGLPVGKYSLTCVAYSTSTGLAFSDTLSFSVVSP